MKITVTGGSGFLGSHVADALTRAGHRVTVFDRRPSPWLSGRQRMLVGDILDPGSVDRALRGADAVYHMAGLADIEAARRLPLETVTANVAGTVGVLQSAHRAGVKRFVFASSLYVYSGAGSFYRVSKQACEGYIEAFREERGLRYTVLRYGSLYGPRADEKNGVYRWVRDAVERRAIVYPGDGNELREYIHVLDAARASADVLTREYEDQRVLITGQQPCRVRDLLGMIREELGGAVKIRYRPDKATPLHYRLTPYSFVPREAVKLVPTRFVDLGQGLLSLLVEAHRKAGQKGQGPDVP